MATSLQSWGIPQFKQLLGVDVIQVVKNPKTDKKFVSTSGGRNFRCQGDIDLSQPMHFIGEDIDNACLVNVGRGENTLAIL